ncbi:type II toxin-antitoxin system HicA family toxin [Lactobacillus sp. PV037]|uniref:type II toxin-antitoxin system HicA family toxin n=1 Tax=Lactobacillus sp. PV037 TaxID=2594496 RepID=UPI00223F8FDB|nr:type II toxin-antitoxin system HicA family toxin [Lactobacillus sp. PV037]QNQ83899.1 type II toxin-antitoxin system HicA family toxin [Lactobacillus sp. PV037]
MVQYLAIDLVKKAKKAGFKEDRIRGDHHIFVNPKDGKMVAIPFSKRKDTIAVGTAHSILRVING